MKLQLTTFCLIQVVNAVLGIVLIQALRREEEVMYRRNQ